MAAAAEAVTCFAEIDSSQTTWARLRGSRGRIGASVSRINLMPLGRYGTCWRSRSTTDDSFCALPRRATDCRSHRSGDVGARGRAEGGERPPPTNRGPPRPLVRPTADRTRCPLASDEGSPTASRAIRWLAFTQPSSPLLWTRRVGLPARPACEALEDAAQRGPPTGLACSGVSSWPPASRAPDARRREHARPSNREYTNRDQPRQHVPSMRAVTSYPNTRPCRGPTRRALRPTPDRPGPDDRPYSTAASTAARLPEP